MGLDSTAAGWSAVMSHRTQLMGIARKLAGRGYPCAEAIFNEGSIRFVEKFEFYDPNRGSVATFAWHQFRAAKASLVRGAGAMIRGQGHLALASYDGFPFQRDGDERSGLDVVGVAHSSTPNHEARLDLSRAFRGATPDEHDAITICVVDDLTNQECVELTGYQRSTMNSRLSRFRKRVRAHVA